jgi:hypothetical protein
MARAKFFVPAAECAFQRLDRKLATVYQARQVRIGASFSTTRSASCLRSIGVMFAGSVPDWAEPVASGK